MDLEKSLHHDGDGVISGGLVPDDSKSSPSASTIDHVMDPNDAGEVQVMNIRQRNGVLRTLRRAETWMNSKMQFEAMGVERVPEDKRVPPGILNMGLIWFSMLMSPGLVSAGMLGPFFGLSVRVSIILTVFGTVSGACVPAFTATLSPPTGLRQIAVARYSFGIWGAKLCGVLNVIVNLGFGVINCIIGGQLLKAVSGGSLPLAVGIVIMVVLTCAIVFFGFGVIHQFERYAWILAFVLLCVQWGESARYFSPSPGVSSVSGLDFSGAALNYFAAIFGLNAAWAAISGDYYVHFPANTSKWTVFALTHVGISIPSIFVCALGNCYGGIVVTNETLAHVYDDGGLGALILATMRPLGYAKFACVVYVLSFLGNQVVNIYSSALSIQLWGKHFMAIPRFLWCTLLSGILLALSWGGRDKLFSILSNFLPLLGYWTICFGCILFIENFWFRPRLPGGYDLGAWQDQKRMPWGLGGVGALLIGIGFSFLGMAQTWYTAPIAKHIGATGGDVGDYLSFVSVCISYPILRTLEIKWLGR